MRTLFRLVTLVLPLAIATTATALPSCPGGVVIPSEGGVLEGTTCGEENGYTPLNAYQHPALGAPDFGGVIMMPAGPYTITLEADFAALAEVRDIQGRTDCLGGVYGYAKVWAGQVGVGSYTGFDAPRPLQIVVDGRYRNHCGNFRLTVTPSAP